MGSLGTGPRDPTMQSRVQDMHDLGPLPEGVPKIHAQRGPAGPKRAPRAVRERVVRDFSGVRPETVCICGPSPLAQPRSAKRRLARIDRSASNNDPEGASPLLGHLTGRYRLPSGPCGERSETHARRRRPQRPPCRARSARTWKSPASAAPHRRARREPSAPATQPAPKGVWHDAAPPAGPRSEPPAAAPFAARTFAERPGGGRRPAVESAPATPPRCTTPGTDTPSTATRSWS